MKKTLVALVVAGSFVLAGCSSSDSARTGGDYVPDRPEPVDPGFGIGTEIDRPTPDFGDTPDWNAPDNNPDRPEPADPDFGIGTEVDRPTPDVDNTPGRPEPVDPDFGIGTEVDRPTPDFGDTPEWGVSTDPEVSPALRNIDRNQVRDAIRSRLNG